jgi:hypothetical protein
MDEVHCYQRKKVVIIECTDAVIEPFTVMIKDSYTSIAFSAMFSPAVDMSLTDLTHEIEISVNYLLPIT